MSTLICFCRHTLCGALGVLASAACGDTAGSGAPVVGSGVSGAGTQTTTGTMTGAPPGATGSSTGAGGMVAASPTGSSGASPTGAVSGGGGTGAPTGVSTATAGGTSTVTGNAGSPGVGSGGTPSGAGTSSGGGISGVAGASAGGGMGSSAGGGGTSSGGGSNGNDPDASAFLMREDFESYTLGGLPTGGPWLAAEDCEQFSSQFSRTISGDEVHGGTQALKLTNHHFPQCRLSANFGQATEYWVRAHIYYGTDLDFSGKELLALDLLPAAGVGQDSMAVRFGSRTKEPCTEVGGPQITIIGIGGGEATGCADYPMPQGEWICFVAHVDQTSGLSVDTSINGLDHTFKSVGMEDRDRIEAFGSPGASIDHLRVGLFAHNSQANGTAYIDDLDVATQPLTCD